MRNAHAENFIGRFRDECLNQSPFGSLAAARRRIAAWRIDATATRLHAHTMTALPITLD